MPAHDGGQTGDPGPGRLAPGPGRQGWVSGGLGDQLFSTVVTVKFEPTFTVTWLPSGFVMWAS